MKKSEYAISHDNYYLWSASGIELVKRSPPSLPIPLEEELHVGDGEKHEHRHYPRLNFKFPILYKILGHHVSHIPEYARSSLTANTACSLESNNARPLCPKSRDKRSARPSRRSRPHSSN